MSFMLSCSKLSALDDSKLNAILMSEATLFQKVAQSPASCAVCKFVANDLSFKDCASKLNKKAV